MFPVFPNEITSDGDFIGSSLIGCATCGRKPQPIGCGQPFCGDRAMCYPRFFILRGPTDNRNSGCEHAGYMGAYNCLFIFFPAVPSRALSPTPRPKDFADGTGKARTYEYVAGGEGWEPPFPPPGPRKNGKQGRRQGKTQLLTTVSPAASSEAASPFFGVT